MFLSNNFNIIGRTWLHLKVAVFFFQRKISHCFKHWNSESYLSPQALFQISTPATSALYNSYRRKWSRSKLVWNKARLETSRPVLKRVHNLVHNLPAKTVAWKASASLATQVKALATCFCSYHEQLMRSRKRYYSHRASDLSYAFPISTQRVLKKRIK